MRRTNKKKASYYYEKRNKKNKRKKVTRDVIEDIKFYEGVIFFERDVFLGFKLLKANHNQLWLWKTLEEVDGI